MQGTKLHTQKQHNSNYVFAFKTSPTLAYTYECILLRHLVSMPSLGLGKPGGVSLHGRHVVLTVPQTSQQPVL